MKTFPKYSKKSFRFLYLPFHSRLFIFVFVFLFQIFRFLIPDLASAQSIPQHPNKTNAEGKKEGTWTILYDKDWNVITNADSTAFYRLITYENGKPKGIVKDFYRNGQVQMEGKQISENPDTFDSLSTYYSEKGDIISYKFYKKGKFDYEMTMQYLEKLLLIQEKTIGKKHPNYVASLNSLANLYFEQRKYEKVESFLIEVKNIKESIFGKQHFDYALSLNNLAGLYMKQGKYAKSEPLYVETKEIYVKILGKENLYYINSLNNLAGAYTSQGDYYHAEPLLIEGKDICEKVLGKTHPDYARALINLALLYKLQGKYTQAEPLYIEGKNINEKILGKEHPDYATALNNLASLYQDQGLYAKSEPFYIEAKEITLKALGKTHPDYAMYLNNLAILYKDQGLYTKSEPFYIEAKEITLKALGNKHPYYAISLNNLALLYYNQNRYLQAESLFLEAKEITLKALGDKHPNYATSLNNLALLYYNQNRYLQAELLFVEAKNIREKVLGKEHPDYANSWNNLAALYSEQGKYAQAELFYIESKKISEKVLGKEHPSYAQYLTNLANSYYNQHKYSQSKPLYSQLIHVYIKQIGTLFPTLSEKEKGSFYTNKVKGNFYIINSFALQAHNQFPELRSEIYNLQLATKALLLNSTAKWKQRIVGSGDRKLRSLFDDWEQKRQQFAKFSQMSIEDQKRQGIRLDSLEAQINGLEKVLSQRSELFASLADRKQYTWKDVQAKLKQGEAAIEIIRVNKYGVQKVVTDSSAVDKDSVYTYPKYPLYGLTDTVHYAALIVTPQTKTHPDLVLLTNGNDLEGKYLNQYSKAMKYKLEDKNGYTQFWQKIKNKLQGVKKIYFSPDGVYHQINLNTLKNPQTGKYVIDEIQVVPVTNTKDIVLQKKEESANTFALLFGSPDYQLDETSREKKVKELNENVVKSSYLLGTERGSMSLAPLPSTKIEVENISKLLQAKGYTPQVYLEGDALEENLKNSFKPSILHIATHGFFESENKNLQGFENLAGLGQKNPLLRSGLMLAGAGYSLSNPRPLTVEEIISGKERIEDGILTAYEAMNLNLDNTELVVLSACETGLGEVMNGEGVYGLQRAFKVAGAKSILMSLWKVDDKTTQELMTLFYEYWLTGNSKQAAFKMAQMKLREKYKMPYYWGCFVMVGE